jgi:hypothetical protein
LYTALIGQAAVPEDGQACRGIGEIERIKVAHRDRHSNATSAVGFGRRSRHSLNSPQHQESPPMKKYDRYGREITTAMMSFATASAFG